MGGIIVSRFGSFIGQFLQHTSYWAVKLTDDTWVCELDLYRGLREDHPYYDWTLDLVGTGDIMRVKELWLFCPKNWYSPLGNTARIPVAPGEEGTIFQFCQGNKSFYGKGPKNQIIGKLTDRASGDCNCFIWDGHYKLMIANWPSNVNNFRTWDKAVAARLHSNASHMPDTLGPLSKDTIGLRDG